MTFVWLYEWALLLGMVVAFSKVVENLVVPSNQRIFLLWLRVVATTYKLCVTLAVCIEHYFTRLDKQGIATFNSKPGIVTKALVEDEAKED